MSSAPHHPAGITLEEFLKLPDIEECPAAEFIDGRVVRKAMPKAKHAMIQVRLSGSLYRFAEPPGLGLALMELRCTFAGRSIVPDVVFLLDEHIGADEHGEIEDLVLIPPDIHVEIISPDQSVKDSHEKLLHSTAHGCPLGWLIHPEKKTIDVYRPGRPPERLPDDGALDGEPVLPGFRLPVAEVFSWLSRRPPGGGPA